MFILHISECGYELTAPCLALSYITCQSEDGPSGTYDLEISHRIAKDDGNYEEGGNKCL